MNQAHLVTATTDDGTLAAHPCRLKSVTVGVVEAATTISIYDSASTTDNLRAVISCATLGHYPLELDMANGLHVVTTATGTARITLVRE